MLHPTILFHLAWTRTHSANSFFSTPAPKTGSRLIFYILPFLFFHAARPPHSHLATDKDCHKVVTLDPTRPWLLTDFWNPLKSLATVSSVTVTHIICSLALFTFHVAFGRGLLTCLFSLKSRGWTCISNVNLSPKLIHSQIGPVGASLHRKTREETLFLFLLNPKESSTNSVSLL